jgi:hypothetical protein
MSSTIGMSFGLQAVTLSVCYFIRYTQIGEFNGRSERRFGNGRRGPFLGRYPGDDPMDD